MLYVFCWQSNVIEAGPNMQRESEKEWYYGNADKERLGPYSFEEVIDTGGSKKSLITIVSLLFTIRQATRTTNR